MTKGEQLASIIQKLREKQNAYMFEAIAESVLTDPTMLDITSLANDVFQLIDIKVLNRTELTNKNPDGSLSVQSFYSLSPFYRNYLKDAPQTAAIVECYQILFPEGDKEAIQTELFSELNTISELKKEFLK